MTYIHYPVVIILLSLQASIYYYKHIQKDKLIDAKDERLELLINENKRLKKDLKLSPLTVIKYRAYVQETNKDKQFVEATNRSIEMFLNENKK